jgi:alpha-tubulin suppressor-like RCC1 family protein
MYRGGSFKEILFNIYADLKKTINGEINNANEETQAYANDTVKPELDSYAENTIKPGLDDYVTDEKKTELDSYTTDKKEELDTYEFNKESQLDTYRTGTVEPAIDTYTTAKKGELDTYKNAKITEINESVGTLQESDLTNDYTGNSETLVPTQKALSEGLGTKSDNHDHPYKAYDWTPSVEDGAEIIDYTQKYQSAIRIKKIARGDSYASNIALTMDNRVIFWGSSDNYGCVGSVDVQGMNEAMIPDCDTSEVIDIAESGQNKFVLFENGNLWGWGYNKRGTLGTGDTSSVTVPTLLITNVAEIYPTEQGSYNMDYGMLYIKKNDGTWWGTGANEYGRMGDGTSGIISTFTQLTIPTGHTEITRLWNLGFGYGVTFVEVEDGSVYGCGYNASGQLGDGTKVSNSTWTELIFPETVTIKDIQGGYGYYTSGGSGVSFTVFLSTNGAVYTCGDNGYGQLGDGTTSDNSTVTKVLDNGVDEITVIGGGAGSVYCTYASKDKLTVWGYNNYGQLGVGTTSTVTTPTEISISYDEIFGNTSGNLYSLCSQVFLKNGTEVWATGHNGAGNLGTGDSTNCSTFTKTAIAGNIVDIKSKGYNSGGRYTLILTENGSLFGVGYGGRDNLDGIFENTAPDTNTTPRRMF